MKSADNELHADKIEVDLMNGKAHASGNVLVSNAGEKLSADKIDLDLETKHGVIVQGKIYIKNENFYITGESFERFDENNYTIINGTFTTCDGEVPSWKFSASRIDIEIDGYVFAKNPVFYIKNVPTFYLPVVIFPIKTTRQSGFLPPYLGYSSDNGTLFKLPYYQVISDSMDATITPDFQSKRGKGLDTEFRYVLRENSSGITNWYIMDEYGNDDNRWKLNYRHQEYFSPTLFLKIDMTDISDIDYFNDFGEDSDERNKEKLESNVTLTKIFNNATIQMEYSHDKDLVYDEAAGDPSSTHEQAPKVISTLYKTRIGDSAFSYSGSAIFNNYIQKTSIRYSHARDNGYKDQVLAAQ
jgi:LPS-assembly protein